MSLNISPAAKTKTVVKTCGLWLSLLLAAAGTVALLLFQDQLLSRRVVIGPAEAKNYTALQYNDTYNGGTSTVRAIREQVMSWTCTLTRAATSPYCGVGLAFDRKTVRREFNLTQFDTLKLNLTYQGPSHLVRVTLKNSNPLYSRPGDPSRDKYNYADAKVGNGTQTVALELKSFVVAEWWRALMNLPPELSRPELSSVVGVEVQTGTDALPGEYQIKIHEIAFEQRIISSARLYAAISAFWLLCIAMLLLRRRRNIMRQKAKEALEHKWASEHDELTGLANRRLFRARLEEAVATSRAKGKRTGLLLLDLDHFKHVNDTLGHQAGDELLKAVSERLRLSLRGNDFVARIGGDEFAIILDDVKDGDDLVRIGNQILERMLPPIRLVEEVVTPGGSLGGALFPYHAEDADGLFKAADTALYALKESGRGGTKLFHPVMLDEAQAAAAQLSQARSAVTGEAIIPYYQPKVDLVTGERVGFEALLRCSASEGLKMPSSVERAFDDYDLAAKIGDQMQRAVARDLAHWTEGGLNVRRVSINASPAEFLRDDYAQRLLRVIKEEGVSPSMIEVEVTEHVFFERSADQVSRAVQLLRGHGVRISLDDFGTGYSSLSHLRDIRVDSVKIDRSFVAELHSDREIAAIVSAVTMLSNSLGMDVVAEGVETEAQADMLRIMGCGFGQGFLYGKPMPAKDVKQLLTNDLPRRLLRA